MAWKRNRKRPAGAGRRVVGYVRVSTEDQAREGVSLGAQEARLRAFCEGTGRVLDEIVADAGKSAKDTSRAGLQGILDGVRGGGIGTVLVLKLDRLTRSIRDLADLLDLFSKSDVSFVSVQESLDTGSAAGRMITNLLGVLAQFEREQIAERTSFALAHKRRNGRVYGRTPFGFSREGDSLVPVREEQHALAHIRQMDASGSSYRKIGAWLTENGFRPKGGASVWHAASVRRLLLSKIVSDAPLTLPASSSALHTSSRSI